MIRHVLGDDGGLAVDLAGREFGRGAWVHPRVDCLERAARGGAARSFKAKVTTDAAELVAQVKAAADRRVEALVASARGAGKAASGSEVAKAAFDEGKAELVVVAADGRAVTHEGFVVGAQAVGKAVAWGTKARLGRATGRPDTAVVAILDRGLAAAIVRATALASLPASGVRSERIEDAVVEVR